MYAMDINMPGPTNPAYLANTRFSFSKNSAELFEMLTRVVAKYAGFVLPGLLISIAYMDQDV